jgi:hypothetical protein
MLDQFEFFFRRAFGGSLVFCSRKSFVPILYIEDEYEYDNEYCPSSLIAALRGPRIER